MYEILIPSANRFHFPKFRALYMLSIFRNWGLKAIITAMINKMTDKNYITKYKDILTSLDGSFETSMRYEEMTNLFKMQINNNIKWNITSISLDGTGSMQSTYSMGDRKLYVMIPDDDTVNNAKESINKVLNGK